MFAWSTLDAGRWSILDAGLQASRMTSGGNLWRLKETGCMRIPQSVGQFWPERENAQS